MTITTDLAHLTWTPLSVRMGFTAAQQQREEILAAVESMTWTDTPAQPPHLDGAAVRAIVDAVFHSRRDLIQLVGIAQLDGGRQLIGLQDARGARSYVLDLDAEAIHVLVELPHLPHRLPAASRSRVA